MPSPASKKILHIEDNADSALIMARLLTLWGYHCLSAENGASGLRQIEIERPDLLLLDLNLPDIHGLEIVRQLRARSERLPIIAVTANALPSDRSKALEAGVDEFLAKPIDFPSLRALLDKFLPPAG